jgi:hypothetical protein
MIDRDSPHLLDVGFTQTLASYRNLRKLILASPFDFADPTFSLAQLSHLRELELDPRCRNVKRLLSGCTSLRILELLDYGDLQDDDYTPIPWRTLSSVSLAVNSQGPARAFRSVLFPDQVRPCYLLCLGPLTDEESRAAQTSKVPSRLPLRSVELKSDLSVDAADPNSSQGLPSFLELLPLTSVSHLALQLGPSASLSVKMPALPRITWLTCRFSGRTLDASDKVRLRYSTCTRM